MHEGENDSYGPSFCNNFGKFVRNVAISGISYVADVTEIPARRIWWLILILAGTGLMIYQVTTQVIYYLSYPTSVSQEFVYPAYLDFPQITVCNENLFRLDIIQDIDSKYGLNKTNGIEKLLILAYPPIRINRSLEKFSGLNWTILDTLDWGEIYRNASYQPDEMLVTCEFGGETCDPETYFKQVPTNMGYCISLKSEKLKLRQSSEGSMHGLTLNMVIQQDQYIANPGYSAGFRVYAHHPGIFPDMLESGFRIGAGMVTNVALEKTVITRLGNPFGNCSSTSLQYYNTYTKKHCQSECRTRLMLKECGCVIYGFIGDASMSVCNPAKAYQCELLLRNRYEDISAVCVCTDECYQDRHSAIISSAEYSKRFIGGIAKMTGNLVKPQDIESDTVTLTIYYSRIMYQAMTTIEAYTLMSLFCDIGGALGLLLGSTFFTLYEVLDFFIWQLYTKVRRKRVAGSD